MSPSAEPVTKNSSIGSTARHFIADSWAWNFNRSVRCLTSKIHTSPFFPAEMTYWCCGARTKLEAPCSWQTKAETGKNVNLRKSWFNWWVCCRNVLSTCDHCLLLGQEGIPNGNVFALGGMAGSCHHAAWTEENEIGRHLIMALVRLQK